MKKEEEKVVKTLTQKANDMFDFLHISREMGAKMAHVLTTEMAKTKKPMALLGDRGVEFFKGKMGDKHTPILLSIYCLIFSDTLLNPTIGVITMSNYKDRIIKP